MYNNSRHFPYVQMPVVSYIMFPDGVLKDKRKSVKEVFMYLTMIIYCYKAL